MIRQAAFENATKMLKGGLHCHTTRSDGHGTPEEVMRLHKANCYDFLAITDHCNYNYTNYAPETGITIIPAMEIDINMPSPGNHCHHIVCIGPTKEDGNGFEQDQRFDSVDIEDPYEAQPILDIIHKENNMTLYCHPEWSGVSARDFENLQGNFAMEIWNSGCAIENDMDTNAAYWDELLIQGKKIYGVATDDGHAMDQHCVGWVRVNAENNINSILEALKIGAFYSSCGPEIYDFYIEDGVAHIRCSEVVEIKMCNFRVPYNLITNPDNTPLTGAECKLREGTGYVRAVIKDAQGRRAWTNPIFF
ncbi:MAG: CehA/McbA family metallohydrolase [Clostridiales bacterium]|nr:CehA/McbA family metallohydrolase [Clostridiales bacterium]